MELIKRTPRHGRGGERCSNKGGGGGGRSLEASSRKQGRRNQVERGVAEDSARGRGVES